MKKIFLTLSLCFIILSCHAKSQEVFFSPSLDCENQIISLIDNTKQSLDVAIYSFTNENIAEAIYRANNRHVQIRILADTSQAKFKYSQVIPFYQRGINIRVATHYKIFHDKLAIFDNKKIVIGSYNWTESATHNNHEYCMIINKDSKAVENFIKEFNKQWDFNTKKRSERWFAKMMKKRRKV